MSDRQAVYEERYFERREADRPKPTYNLSALKALAEAAQETEAGRLAFVNACSPDNFLKAMGAQAWDRRHPFYSCIVCHDGKDLPRGYVCRECGEEGS